MRRLVRYAGVAVAGLACFGSAISAEFSAETVDAGPQGVMSRGKIYVSGDRMRSETSRGGVKIVTLLDKAQNKQWLLYPGDQSYVETSSDGTHPSPDNPCAGLAGATCNPMGTERISGRRTEKWEVILPGDGAAKARTYHWIDRERGIPLRQQFPDGSRIHWRRVGLDKVEGRNVEKWQVVVDRPGQTPVRSFQWIDPDLNVSVREEIAGGFVRELQNIHVGPQSDELFDVPAHFRPVTPVGPGAGPGS